jgi:hypothetical protein
MIFLNLVKNSQFQHITQNSDIILEIYAKLSRIEKLLWYLEKPFLFKNKEDFFLCILK